MATPQEIMNKVMEAVNGVIPNNNFVIVVESLGSPGSLTVAAVSSDSGDPEEFKRKLLREILEMMDAPELGGEIRRGTVCGGVLIPSDTVKN